MINKRGIERNKIKKKYDVILRCNLIMSHLNVPQMQNHNFYQNLPTDLTIFSPFILLYVSYNGHSGSHLGHSALHSSSNRKHGWPGRFWQQEQASECKLLPGHFFVIQNCTLNLLSSNVVELTTLALASTFILPFLLPPWRRHVAYNILYFVLA